jgi:hypothetical protein
MFIAKFIDGPNAGQEVLLDRFMSFVNVPKPREPFRFLVSSSGLEKHFSFNSYECIGPFPDPNGEYQPPSADYRFVEEPNHV